MIQKGDTIICVLNYAFEYTLELGKRYVAESDENEKDSSRDGSS